MRSRNEKIPGKSTTKRSTLYETADSGIGKGSRYSSSLDSARYKQPADNILNSNTTAVMSTEESPAKYGGQTDRDSGGVSIAKVRSFEDTRISQGKSKAKQMDPISEVQQEEDIFRDSF